MENTSLWIKKEGHRKKDSLHSLCNDRELSDEDSSKSQLKKLIKRSNSRRAIAVNAIQSQISKLFFKDLFFRHVHGVDNRIPKHMVSVDEKYLRRCLELVHNIALKAAQCNIPVSLRAKHMGTLSESLNTAGFFAGDTSGHFVFECPVSTEMGRVVISADAGEQWPLDDQKEVYVANLRKVDSTEDKALDYVYHFHKGGQKGHVIPDNDLQLVGKMNVSTSFTLCPSNCKVKETEFTLFQNAEIYDKEMYTSEYSHRKNKGLTKKVSQVFRTSPSSKRRTLSKFGGSSAIAESCPWEPYALGGANLLETNVPHNFEMAAIVVKDHLPCNKPDKVGGWGLKFLKKSGVNQTTLPSESCNKNNGDCSSTTSILIPAGLHGGPRTRNGGPSSLIDRWRSGGHCDCGGWDEGCPLTVLQRRSSKAEVLSQVDTQGECKSVDLITQ
ncbi:hypothetical protein SESBI_48370, partial [Sesbania bispinosa]